VAHGTLPRPTIHTPSSLADRVNCNAAILSCFCRASPPGL
jgi:hypothetical protein